MLDALMDGGSNLALPHPISHYLYFGDKGVARKAGKTLKKEGYAVDVRLGAEGLNWLVLASHTATPRAEIIARTTARMENLAAVLRGEYDGWEAKIIKA